MAQRIGSASRYRHHSGPQRDDDEEEGVAFDYTYYETYDDYCRSRGARYGSDDDDEPLHDSSDDDDHGSYVRRRRRSRDRRRDIGLHSPRAAAAAAGAAGAAYLGARSVGRNKTSRADLASRAPRSMPTPAGDFASSPPKYATPRGRPALPANWAPVFSQAHGRWYYVNTLSGKRQWEAPGFEVAAVQEQQQQRQQKERGLVPPRSASPGAGSRSRRRRNSSHSHSSHRSSGVSITGMLLGAAGGIAAGTLVAKALKKDHFSSAGSDRSIRRRGSRSDRDDVEHDGALSHRHSHGSDDD